MLTHLAETDDVRRRGGGGGPSMKKYRKFRDGRMYEKDKNPDDDFFFATNSRPSPPNRDRNVFSLPHVTY